MNGLGHDLTYTCRRLGRAYGFTSAAVITLALGIGANTALFTLFNSILLKPPAVPAIDRLVGIRVNTDREPAMERPLSDDRFRRLQDRQPRLIEEMTPVLQFSGVLSSDRGAHVVMSEAVTSPYFRMCGVSALLGRVLLPSDDREGDAVVISERLWKRLFTANPRVVGQRVRLSGQVLTVVGVLPESFSGLSIPNLLGVDAWLPLRVIVPQVARPREQMEDGTIEFRVFGRLKPGVRLSDAKAEIRVLGASIDPLRAEYGLTIVPATHMVMPGILRFYLTLGGTVMLALSTLVLVIAGANLTNLLLARTAGRTGEFAVRLMLGASRGRILRLFAVETSVIAVLAGALGLIVALITAHTFAAIPLPELGGQRLQFDPSPDWRVFGYSFLMTVVVAVVIGVVPALRALKADMLLPLVASSGTPGMTGGDAHLRVRLMAAQIACSTLLLIVAGLFVRSTLTGMTAAPQMDTARTAMGDMDYASQHYDETRGREVSRQLLATVAQVPGVERAALGTGVPAGRGGAYRAIGTRERRARRVKGGLYARYLSVSPGFFDTLGISVRGRDFTARDVKDGPAVAIVNESAASTLWPGEDPIGKHLSLLDRGRNDALLLIVGVAADTDQRSPDPVQRRFVFVPLEQHYTPQLAIIARGTAAGEALIRPLQNAVRQVAPELALFNVRTVAAHVDLDIVGLRLGSFVLGCLGLLGALIAIVGLYGIIAYTVSQRTREFAIRKALGASHGDLYRMMTQYVGRILIQGIPLGLVIAFVLAAYFRRYVLGLRPYDWSTFVFVPLGFAFIAVALSLWPLRRALHTPTQVALREL